MNNKRSRSTYDGMGYSSKAFGAQFNPYKEALLNPISGPLVGVPTSVPVDTHRARLKATGTITVTGGNLVVLGNPVTALVNDAIGMVSGTSVPHGPVVWAAATNMNMPTAGQTFLSNASYSRSQFAGVTGASVSNVRGRVVSAAMRICNVSAANTRNGVFTLFQDPQHTTLQDKTASTIATDPKARQYNASTDAWHTVTYHPVDPEEVDGWVWDPQVGPQAGVKTGTYGSATALDGTLQDNVPGYMGLFWRGDAVSQTFQVELYVIAEYVGSLVQPLVRPIGVSIEDAQGGREAAEDLTAHSATPAEGANHTGHPHSDTHPSRAQRMLDFGKEHAGALKKVAKAGAIGIGGLIGGPQGAMAAAEYLLSAEDMQALGRFDAAQKKIRSKSSPATPSRRPAIGYGRQPQPGDLSNSRGDFRYRGPARIR